MLLLILKKLENKELSPDAFHLRELVPTIDADPEDIDELTVWEYRISDDILKIEWDMEDFADCIAIYLNNKCVYAMMDDGKKTCRNMTMMQKTCFFL